MQPQSTANANSNNVAQQQHSPSAVSVTTLQGQRRYSPAPSPAVTVNPGGNSVPAPVSLPPPTVGSGHTSQHQFNGHTPLSAASGGTVPLGGGGGFCAPPPPVHHHSSLRHRTSNPAPSPMVPPSTPFSTTHQQQHQQFGSSNIYRQQQHSPPVVLAPRSRAYTASVHNKISSGGGGASSGISTAGITSMVPPATHQFNRIPNRKSSGTLPCGNRKYSVTFSPHQHQQPMTPGAGGVRQTFSGTASGVGAANAIPNRALVSVAAAALHQHHLHQQQQQQQHSNIDHDKAVDTVLFGGSARTHLEQQQTINRRKTFRCRGSLGPTIVSAPSVEQEEYRSPKPSAACIARLMKMGMSFDVGTAANAASVFQNNIQQQCSEKNGLIKVSADFLRLNGSRQQFRSLLGRKKLGQMPPAYTQIDCSFESNDSHHTGSPSGPPGIVRPSTTMGNHPLIKVEEAGSGVNQKHPRAIIKPDEDGRLSPSSSAYVLVDSSQQQKSGICSPSATGSENGSLRGGTGGSVTIVGLCPPKTYASTGNHLSPTSEGGSTPNNTTCFKRNNSRYGAPIDGTAVKMVYKIRSHRLSDRVRIADRCLALALFGILFMVIDNEVTGQSLYGIDKRHWISLTLRALVLVTTVLLLAEIVRYHINDLLLALVDCGADDWRVVLTCARSMKFLAEFVLCSIIPLPGTGTIRWSFVESHRLRSEHSYLQDREVPVDVILSLLMLARLYLVGRFCTLHSKQFQDASTRTLAALNRIKVNFTFVAKTALDQQPMLFLSIFLLIFWAITAWSFAQCERFGRPDETYFMLYANALWFIAITFNGNGYGDIVPKTMFGRFIAILVGISGAVISSILIAVISRKIILSTGQKNVNNFMNDSRLTLAHKNAAARVLQQTWRIYRCMRAHKVSDNVLRQHQRRFLAAIHQFRSIKNEMRMFNESNTTSIQQMNRLMLEMHSHTQKINGAQEELRTQLDCLQNLIESHLIGCCTPSRTPPPLTLQMPLASLQTGTAPASIVREDDESSSTLDLLIR